MAYDHENSSINTRQGFTDALEAIHGLLFTVSYSLLRNQDLCADAVQNALMKAWNKRNSLREPEKFKAWMVRIVMNECKTIMRKPKTVMLNDEIPVEHFNQDIKLDVLNSVFHLDKKYLVPIVLFYYEEMPVLEIARVLGLPKGTVVSRLSRAREQLRKELSDYGV